MSGLSPLLQAARLQRPDRGHDSEEQIRALWLAGVSTVRIAAELDISECAVRAASHRLGLPRRSNRKKKPAP
jgi:hypothetical protein